MTCNKCGWWKPICHCRGASVHFNTYNWVTEGTWEHIDPTQPNMRFSSKEELFAACEKRDLIPKAFLKPKSQGKGYEIRRRGL